MVLDTSFEFFYTSANAFSQTQYARFVGFRQYDDKFLSTVAEHHVRDAYAFFRAFYQWLQRNIAHGMSVPIIDHFEMINVHHDYSQGAVVAKRFFKFLVQGSGHRRAVADFS